MRRAAMFLTTSICIFAVACSSPPASNTTKSTVTLDGGPHRGDDTYAVKVNADDWNALGDADRQSITSDVQSNFPSAGDIEPDPAQPSNNDESGGEIAKGAHPMNDDGDCLKCQAGLEAAKLACGRLSGRAKLVCIGVAYAAYAACTIKYC